MVLKAKIISKKLLCQAKRGSRDRSFTPFSRTCFRNSLQRAHFIFSLSRALLFFSFFIIHKMVERSNPETGRFLSSSTQHNVYNLRKRSHPEKSKITKKSKKVRKQIQSNTDQSFDLQTFITSRKSSITWNNLPAPVLVKILENFRNVQGPERVFLLDGEEVSKKTFFENKEDDQSKVILTGRERQELANSISHHWRQGKG